jgi:hypothetical protein
VTSANQHRLYHQSSGWSPDQGTQEKREAKEDPSAWRGPRPRKAALASTADEDRRSTDQVVRGKRNEETVTRAEKEEGTN